MKKQKTWWLSGLLIAFLCSCGGNESERIKEDTIVSGTDTKSEIVEKPTNPKSDLITKDWKATELTLGETKLAADAVGGVYFSFKPDGTFSYTETGNTETGSWNMDKDNKIVLKYTEGKRSVIQNIKELSTDKLVVDYVDHGMKRNLVMVPGSK
jgi:hypothetical protein